MTHCVGGRDDDIRWGITVRLHYRIQNFKKNLILPTKTIAWPLVSTWNVDLTSSSCDWTDAMPRVMSLVSASQVLNLEFDENLQDTTATRFCSKTYSYRYVFHLKVLIYVNFPLFHPFLRFKRTLKLGPTFNNLAPPPSQPKVCVLAWVARVP